MKGCLYQLLNHMSANQLFILYKVLPQGMINGMLCWNTERLRAEKKEFVWFAWRSLILRKE